jgi:hypothetical protein
MSKHSHIFSCEKEEHFFSIFFFMYEYCIYMRDGHWVTMIWKRDTYVISNYMYCTVNMRGHAFRWILFVSKIKKKINHCLAFSQCPYFVFLLFHLLLSLFPPTKLSINTPPPPPHHTTCLKFLTEICACQHKIKTISESPSYLMASK